jgi:hypothetical protein
VQQAAAGSGALAITNTSSKTITAIALVGDPVDVPGSKQGTRIRISPLRIYDPATEPRAAKPLVPGQPASIPYPLPFRDASSPPAVRAVIFADGTSWGDPAYVKRLVQRRTYMEACLRTAISDLSIALVQGTARSLLVERFQSALASGEKAATDADESACVRSVSGVVLRNLQEVTQRSDGTPVSTAELVQHELRALGARLATLVDYGGGPSATIGVPGR